MEPLYSNQLRKFVIEYGVLPKEIEKGYVLTIIYCFITNGNGVAWNAEGDYLTMIQNFSNEEALIALTSFLDDVQRFPNNAFENFENDSRNKIKYNDFLESFR